MKDKEAFRTISEVANELQMQQHVLRFWETRFKQIKPMKRGGARRYYRPEDVKLLEGIRHLLYNEGYTIKGVQRILKEKGVRFVCNVTEINIQDENENIENVAAIDVREFVAKPKTQVNVNTNTQNNIVEDASVAVKEVLAELLECKRLLDQTR